MAETGHDLHTLRFPLRRESPFAPPEGYAALRAPGPVSRAALPNGSIVWVVTGHTEARTVLADPRVSGDPTRPGCPMVADDRDRQKDQRVPGFFIDFDPPEHTRLRRMLISEFSVRRIKDMRPGIQRTVDELLNALLRNGSPADLVPALAVPLPSTVICQLLGVPYADHEFFQSRTKAMVSFESAPADRDSAFHAVHGYLSELIARKARQPDGDLLSRLAAEQLATGALDHLELSGMAALLLVAGFETTANLIPLGVAALLRHPAQLALLKENPQLLSAAVEEMLRYFSIADIAMTNRSAIEDFELGGQQIRAGDGIIVLGSMANRDDQVFSAANDFDIRRGSRNHVAFGYGVHQCLGQNLARTELEIVIGTLFERIPALRLDAADELEINYRSAVFGLAGLPVAW